MAAILRLRGKADEIVAAYLELNRQAEVARPRETAAAICIQAAIRSYLLRLHLQQLTDTVVCIQRCWRGYVGRQLFKHYRRIADQQLREAYFDAQATLIQRHWRGFYTRKYIHDFGARKAYLHTIARKNAEMREIIDAEFRVAVEVLHQQEEEAARTRFAQRVIKLHHLLSTETQAGVFRSPYAAVADTLPAVAGVPLEQHIKNCTRQSMTSWRKHMTRPSSLPAIRPKGRKLTIQASEPYEPEVAKAAELRDVYLHRHEVLERHGSPFLTTASCPEPFVKVPSIRSRSEYDDPLLRKPNLHPAKPDAQMFRISKRRFNTAISRQLFFE